MVDIETVEAATIAALFQQAASRSHHNIRSTFSMTNMKSQAASKRRTAATRFVAALAVAATAGSALVGSQIIAPQAAYAAQEQAAGKIDVGEVSVWMGKGVTNASLTDTTTDYNNYVRYGIVRGMSDQNADVLRTDNAPLTTTLGGDGKKQGCLGLYRSWVALEVGQPGR